MRRTDIANTTTLATAALPDRPRALAAALLKSYAVPGAARAAVLTILGVTLAVIVTCAGLEGILI